MHVYHRTASREEHLSLAWIVVELIRIKHDQTLPIDSFGFFIATFRYCQIAKQAPCRHFQALNPDSLYECQARLHVHACLSKLSLPERCFSEKIVTLRDHRILASSFQSGEALLHERFSLLRISPVPCEKSEHIEWMS